MSTRSAELGRLFRTGGVVVAGAVLVAACAGSDSERVGAPECGEQTGRTVEHEVDALSSRADSVLVHLPPCYDAESGRYPTLWLIHGGGTTADMWVNQPLDIGSIADSLALDGEPFVVVMPNGASGRPEFLNGEFEIVLADVDRAFRTIMDPQARAIAGVSAGGTSAAYLAAENEATDFVALGLFMTVWGPTLDERFAAGVGARELQPEVLVDIGDEDGLRTYSDDIEAAIGAAGLTAEFWVHPGDHDVQFVADRLDVWVDWLTARFV